jgi:hypothetical protein
MYEDLLPLNYICTYYIQLRNWFLFIAFSVFWAWIFLFFGNENFFVGFKFILEYFFQSVLSSKRYQVTKRDFERFLLSGFLTQSRRLGMTVVDSQRNPSFQFIEFEFFFVIFSKLNRANCAITFKSGCGPWDSHQEKKYYIKLYVCT